MSGFPQGRKGGAYRLQSGDSESSSEWQLVFRHPELVSGSRGRGKL